MALHACATEVALRAPRCEAFLEGLKQCGPVLGHAPRTGRQVPTIEHKQPVSPAPGPLTIKNVRDLAQGTRERTLLAR
jgi:hypothetical protein